MPPNIRQSSKYGDYLIKLGWTVEKETDFQYFVRKLPLLGNFVKIPKPPTPPNSTIINRLTKKHRAFAVMVDYSPTKTICLDIRPSLQTIRENMNKDNRYELRKAENNGIEIKESQDIETFIQMWQETAKKRGFWIPFGKEIRFLFESFGKKAHLLLAYPPTSSSPVSGALILISGSTAAYFFASSSPEGRKLSSPYLVIWKAIQIAKKNKCEVFDFEGIKDSRDNNTKKWGGFTHFKQGFGGVEIEFPLAKTYFSNPILNFFSRHF